MSDKSPFDDQDLDDLFALAQDETPKVSDGLMTRVIADAQMVVDAHAATPVVHHQGVMASVMAMIGGWPAAAGLATAAVTGVMIGVSAPEALTTLASGAFGDTTATVFEDILPSLDGFLDEG